MMASFLWKSIALLATFASTAFGDGVQLSLPAPQSLYVSQYDGIRHQQTRQYPIMLYTGSRCSMSRESKRILRERCPSLTFGYLNYDEVAGALWVFASSTRESGNHKLPQVYVCDKYIGGKPDLKRMQESGELNQRLSACSNVRCQTYPA